MEMFLNGEITVQEACEQLGVHRITFWRWLRKSGLKAAKPRRHGLTGRRSNRAKSEAFRQQVCNLYEHSYKPHGHSPYSFYDAVARNLPDYVCYKTVLTWLRTPASAGAM